MTIFFGIFGIYSPEGEIQPEKVVTIVYYISWMLNISFTDSYWMHIVLFPMFLSRFLVRLWVIGFESDFGVVVRVRPIIDAVPAASVPPHFRKP